MPLSPHLDDDYGPLDVFDDARDADLYYFLLNVGDGDCQLLLLPRSDGRRHLVVVDVGKAGKLPDFIDVLNQRGLLGAEWRIPLLVVTHPHADHVNGVPELLRTHGDRVTEVWDAAYYHTGKWHEFMYWLEDHPAVARVHPTSGTRRHIGSVGVTALSPSVRLRNAYDTYGVKLNNASIALLVEFPMARVFTGDAQTFPQVGRTDRALRRERLVLGGDAQTGSWSQVEVDFPHLAEDHDPKHRLLGQAKGTEPLGAELFKVPHHLSKHGLNLELVERIKPYLSLTSCADPGQYRFPHDVALEQLREAIESTATGRRQRSIHDAHLGIHTTADLLDEGRRDPLGSIAVRIRPGAQALDDRYQLWRLQDRPRDGITEQRLQEALRYIGPNTARG